MLSLIQSLRATTLTANAGQARLLLLNTAARSPLLDHTAGKRTLESRLGIPERPKKPLSPYFRFMAEVRPGVVAANPQLRLQDIVRQIGTKWETVDAAQKTAYQEAYKRDQIAYVRERAAYEAQLTDAQRFELQDLKQQLADQRTKTAARKRVRELGRPKRAQSPFLCWLNEHARTELPRTAGETFREWQRRSAGVWAQMSEPAKRPFFERSTEAFNKYSDALLQWEEKMVRQGNVDLVRAQMLVDPVEKLSARAGKTKLAKKQVEGVDAAEKSSRPE